MVVLINSCLNQTAGLSCEHLSLPAGDSVYTDPFWAQGPTLKETEIKFHPNNMNKEDGISYQGHI